MWIINKFDFLKVKFLKEICSVEKQRLRGVLMFKNYQRPGSM